MSRDRSLSVKLRADVSNYLAGVKQAGNATREFAGKAGEGVAQHKADWATVGQSVTVAGLAIAAGVGFAVSRFADFDAAMSAAAAATRASARDLGLLRDAAMQAGADTQYSASEAAQAITELGKAGVSTADILGGGLTGALSLAAAGQMDVARAAELSAIAMKQFGLGGDQVSHVADLLAAGAGKAVGSVDDMGMALKQSGLVASQTGVTLEETTGTLAAFASAGLIGSDAGTSFKTMLQRLTPQSKEAAETMSELGISAYDSHGRFIGLSALAGQLQDSLSGLTVEQRNSALATMFGSDAIRAAAVLYEQGAEGISRWTSEVNDQGFAAAQAAQLTDNLRGDIERLGGSLDTALIKTGSGANDALRGLAQGLESVINWFAGLPQPVQSTTTYLAAAASAAALVGGAALSAVPRVQAFKVAMADLGLTSASASAKLGVAAKSIGVVATAAAGLSMAYAGMQGVVNGWMGANDDAVKSLDAMLRSGRDAVGVTGLMKDGFQDLGAAVERAFNESAWIKGTNVLDSVMFWDGSQAGTSIAFFDQLDKALAGFVQGGRAAEAAATFKQLTDEAARQGIPVERLAAAFPAYSAALEAAKTASGGAASATAEAVKSADDYVRATTAAKEATSAYADALRGFTSPILDAREANRQWQESIESAAQAIAENEKAQRNHMLSTAKHAAAQREAERALDGMARAAIDNVSAMAANGASQVTLQGVLDESLARIEAMAIKLGMSAEEARKYAGQLTTIPAVVSTQIFAKTKEAYGDIVALAQKLDSLRDRTIYIRTVTTAVNMDSSATGYNRASGGPIFGPGTATSDSIPAWLSNGEYVIRAAAVDKYGLGLMHQINAMRFADGGFVSRAAASQTPQPASPSLAGIAVTGTLDTPWGPAQVRGVVRDEMSSVARVAQLRGR